MITKIVNFFFTISSDRRIRIQDPDPGSEIPDFQFEDPDPDPDPKLLISDPEHWREVGKRRKFGE